MEGDEVKRRKKEGKREESDSEKCQRRKYHQHRSLVCCMQQIPCRNARPCPRDRCSTRAADVLRPHIASTPLPWVILAICFLPAPRAGAEFHCAVSSPDLAAAAREWGTRRLSSRPLQMSSEERLTEPPEMRLKNHLDALKAVASGFACDDSLGAKRIANPRVADQNRGMPHTAVYRSPLAASFAGDSAPATPCSVKHEDLSDKLFGGKGPWSKFFDEDNLSTFTPEPSDSLSSAPGLRSGSQPLHRHSRHMKHFNSLVSSSRSLFTDVQPSEFDIDFETQCLDSIEQRSTESGKRALKTSAICFDFDRTLSKDHLHHMTQASRTGLSDEQAIAAFGGRRRIEKLASFLTDLEASGAAIHIISLGHKTDIMSSLASVGLDRLFPAGCIIGCDEIRSLQLVTKAQCTRHVASLYGNPPPKERDTPPTLVKSRTSGSTYCDAGLRLLTLTCSTLPGLQRHDVLLVDDDHEQLLECSESSESDIPKACGKNGSRGAGESDEGTCGTYWVRSGVGLTDEDMAVIGGMARARDMTRRSGCELSL